MKLYMDTINSMKEFANTTETAVIDYYTHKYKLPLNTATALALKITFEINDEQTDVLTVCKLLKNSNVAYVCLDFNDLAPEKDSFLYINTMIKAKCEDKIHTFLNIIEATLVKKSTYFTMLDRVAILGNNVDRYQYYLGQFNGGLIQQ